MLTVPSAFEIGLGDCRWIYKLGGRTVEVSAIVSVDEPAMQWRVSIAGEACKFLAFAHLTLGEHEFAHAGSHGHRQVASGNSFFARTPTTSGGGTIHEPPFISSRARRTSIETIGGDELLYVDGERRGGPYAALRTHPTNGFAFAVVGSLTDSKRAASLAAKYTGHVDDATMLAGSARYWRNVSRGIHIKGSDAAAKAMDTIFPVAGA